MRPDSIISPLALPSAVKLLQGFIDYGPCTIKDLCDLTGENMHSHHKARDALLSKGFIVTAGQEDAGRRSWRYRAVRPIADLPTTRTMRAVREFQNRHGNYFSTKPKSKTPIEESREAIQQSLDDYLKKGGKIQVIPTGLSAELAHRLVSQTSNALRRKNATKKTKSEPKRAKR